MQPAAAVAVGTYRPWEPTATLWSAVLCTRGRPDALTRRGDRPGDLDLLALTVVSESRVTWALYANFSLPMLSVLDLDPMYVTDRRHAYTRQTASSLYAPAY